MDGELKLFTLRNIEVTTRYTAENLKSIIISELEKYDIKSQNVYTMTTDNGSNLIKASKLMSVVDSYDDSVEVPFGVYEDVNDPEIRENQDFVDSIQNESWKLMGINSGLQRIPCWNC